MTVKIFLTKLPSFEGYILRHHRISIHLQRWSPYLYNIKLLEYCKNSDYDRHRESIYPADYLEVHSAFLRTVQVTLSAQQCIN
jgi:hypothetical protein